jgi:hypothetical protein
MTRAAILFLSLILSCLVPAAMAGGHRDGTRSSQDPVSNCSDLYAFRSLEDPRTVVLIANFVPFEQPAGGPNFYSFSDDVVYKFKIDNNGDSLADIVYVFDFVTEVRNPDSAFVASGPISSLQDPDWNVRQFYRVSRVDKNGETVIGKRLLVAPPNIGPSLTPDYDDLAASAIYTLGADTGNGATKTFCGPRDEGFYADLGALYDLLTIRQFPGDHGGGVDSLADLNVHSICLQIPIVDLEGPNGDHIIGVWATSSRPKNLVLDAGGGATTSGKLIQVGRMGMPFMNEWILPIGLKERFNNSNPKGDASQFQTFIDAPEVPVLLSSLYGFSVPSPPRTDLESVYLKGIVGSNQPKNVVPAEMLRLNMSSQPDNPEDRLGLLGGDASGFPNGRRVGDDVVDITLRLLAGVLKTNFNVSPNNKLGDGVDANDKPFLTVFPFLASPHQGF